ncbi:alpha-mannosidase [Brachybacterium sp.]|uniref:alpha-mannosidase n=1 Tax=Brachybacterium sp. TaxID=1891286 RepID=UPI002ED4788E
MHTHPEFTLERLQRVVRDRIAPAVHTAIAPVTLASWQVDGDGEPVPSRHALGLELLPGREAPRYEPFTVGSTWGPAWSTTWFRVEGQVPADAPAIVELTVDLGWEEHSVGGHGEALVHRGDGTPVKALHPRHGWLRLRGPGAQDGLLAEDGSFTLYLEAAANPLALGLPPFIVVDLGEKETAESFQPYELRAAAISAFDQEVWDLARDLEVVGGLLAQLSDQHTRYWRLLDAVDRALSAFDDANPHSATASREELREVLAAPAHASAHLTSAVGHAHIDSAWLWPLRETRRKVARTVSNVLALMDEDPEFVYAMSSAQQFAWLEEDQPELFARMRERIDEGRFLPVGGMWVESDAVMPTGEAMVRQFLLGTRYMREHLGVEPDGVWLPDSFGYSGALPQLARRAGFRWFLTQKISWNDTNTFPHHSFQWEGIDGTRIFTHFPPAETYAAEVSQAELHHAERTFRDKMRSSHSLLLFGYGDGGGGPTREMLGRAHRSENLEGSPRVQLRDPDSFFELAETEYTRHGGAPVWAGELYLELHRGTFTSQLAMKRGNRRSESLLRTVEHLSAAAALRTGAAYPREELEEIWRTVLLLQFHDILPGTSIAWVHREARETYGGIEQQLRELAQRAAAALAASGAQDPPGERPRTAAPARLAPTTRGTWDREEAAAPATVPSPFSGAVPTPRLDAAPATEQHVLDNGLLRVRVDALGHVTSLRDLEAQRELVPDGARLGELQLFRDQPVRWDAWDVDRHVLELPVALDEGAVLTPDPAGAAVDGAQGLTVHRTRGDSRFRVTYGLRPGATALEIDVDVDWHETEHLLKLALPLALHTTTARYETQYGHVERSVTANTSWDEAQYEVSQHRFVHLAEGGYGVGVVNDSSYGLDVRGEGGSTVVRPSLLRGARFPDPDSDKGTHAMRFAVVPGPLPTVIDAAYALNAPVLDSLPALEPLLQLEPASGAAVVDWIKLAEDGSGDVIVRLAELAGGRAHGAFRPAADLAGAHVVETDLLERSTADETTADEITADGTPAAGDSSPALPRALSEPGPLEEATYALRPFQVATLRLTPTNLTNEGVAR